VVVKKTFRYSSGFSYNHLYQPEYFYEKRYKSQIEKPATRKPYLTRDLEYAKAAFIKSLNRGCGSIGRDLNSG